MASKNSFTEIVAHLRHFLPAQAPLKDFIHHNTLHAFQDEEFHSGLRKSAAVFGTKVYLPWNDYKALYLKDRIAKDLLEKELAFAGLNAEHIDLYLKRMEPADGQQQVGQFRKLWRERYQLDLDSKVQAVLFRYLGAYLDQGLAIWSLPHSDMSFLEAIRILDSNDLSSVFKSKNSRARKLLHRPTTTPEELLKLLVADPSWHETYLYDQQFTHPGWSGLFAAVEDQPQTLLMPRKASLHDLIVFELLLEIDILDHFAPGWKPLTPDDRNTTLDLHHATAASEIDQLKQAFHTAFEKTYYRQVLSAVRHNQAPSPAVKPDFQAVFCIDDRECSLRRHLEQINANIHTFGTPGFFGVEFFYQPEGSPFFTKLCPAPVTPKYLIKQTNSGKKQDTDFHFGGITHSFFGGWLVSQTLGYWSALRLFWSLFRPSMTPATATSLRHMERESALQIEASSPPEVENGLQLGFTIEEMSERVFNMLKSIGLTRTFADLVYLVAHGSSSVNNPHYAAYDCGACSGRPGSVNSRVFATMANHPLVRKNLAQRGLIIPDSTVFVGAIHDTTRDEIEFFDEALLTSELSEAHRRSQACFANALDETAKERARKFLSLNPKGDARSIHEQVKLRSVSLFEPRPELNHATNAICVVGPREMTRGLFLDRRSFLNSYDPTLDPDGAILARILGAAAPVCGGINLEYYFSRVDNSKFGAGTKLPHNVIGLFAVANGVEGDLRPGLPSQMIEVHDPIRLLIVVFQQTEIILKALNVNSATKAWFDKEWVHLASVDPANKQTHWYKDGSFKNYPTLPAVPVINSQDIAHWLENEREGIPPVIVDRQSSQKGTGDQQ